MPQNEFDTMVLDAGNDGASVMDRAWERREATTDDAEDLLEAWLAERGKSVEAELLLSRARHTLSLLIAAAIPVPTATRREIRHLIAEINDQLR